MWRHGAVYALDGCDYLTLASAGSVFRYAASSALATSSSIRGDRASVKMSQWFCSCILCSDVMTRCPPRKRNQNWF